MMVFRSWCRRGAVLMLAGGALFAGSCGITTLQLQDFVTSTAIRTLVSTTAQIVEAIVIENAASNP